MMMAMVLVMVVMMVVMAMVLVMVVTMMVMAMVVVMMVIMVAAILMVLTWRCLANLSFKVPIIFELVLLAGGICYMPNFPLDAYPDVSFCAFVHTTFKLFIYLFKKHSKKSSNNLPLF